ncbi:hypothetical protein AAG906_001305 [Vitis piasezkii]
MAPFYGYGPPSPPPPPPGGGNKYPAAPPYSWPYPPPAQWVYPPPPPPYYPGYHPPYHPPYYGYAMQPQLPQQQRPGGIGSVEVARVAFAALTILGLNPFGF